MADKVIIYIKQTDEPYIPVTARIEWLPDGKIKPIMYWMPDGSCHQVSRTYEMTLCAYLKSRREGIRFKVEAEIIETPDMDESVLHNTYETYLYFADNWFCGKNFIDGRYDHEGKEYIPVTLDIFPDGGYELLHFWVHGERYRVEKTIEIEPRGSFYAGGIGVWHKIEARQVNADDDEDIDPNKNVRRIAALYFEVNKWFALVKAA